MQNFTGLEYLKIDIANNFGLDKHSWNYRIDWITINDHQLESISDQAESPVLFRKGVRALRATEKGEALGYPASLDATASGLQIMAVLTGCHTTARNVNLGDTGNRENFYGLVAKKMSTMPGVTVDSDIVKKPIMTHFYGSRAKPMQIFGENTPELRAFYNTLEEEAPGPSKLMRAMQGCWNPDALNYEWEMPDGHVVVMKVMAAVEKKIEVDELDHATFTQRAIVNTEMDFGLALAANIVHSVDGYVAREMIRRADTQSFQLATIHDSFWAHPNHMQKVRQNYIDILVDLSKGNLVQNILRQVTGNKTGVYTKESNDLHELMVKSEYALS